MGANIVACSTCKSRMIWVKSPKDVRIPLNADPVHVDAVPPRAVRYAVDLTIAPLRATVAPADAKYVYTSHFATCPQASSHSRKRRIAAERS